MMANYAKRLMILGLCCYVSLSGKQFNGTITPIYAFNGNDGDFPECYPVSAGDRGVYGATMDGGAHGYGTIYWITPQGEVSIVADLNATTDVGRPYYGQFYNGSVYYGGSSGLVRFDTKRNAFAHQINLPVGIEYNQVLTCFWLIDEAVYFMVRPQVYGGSCVLYKLVGDISTKLYETDYCMYMMDGGSMAYAEENNSLYFSINSGGYAGQGALYKVDQSGKVTTVHEFSGYDGAMPINLVNGNQGYIYGNCMGGGGASDGGTLFSVEIATDTFTSLVSFAEYNCPVPSYPTIDDLGNIVGVAASGNSGVYYYDVYNQKLHCLSSPPNWLLLQPLAPSLNGMVFGTTLNNLVYDMYGGLFALNITAAFMEGEQ